MRASAHARDSPRGYVEGYTHEILDQADLDSLVALLPSPPACAALLCVEREARTCHRSLIAARLAGRYGIAVAHLS